MRIVIEIDDTGRAAAPQVTMAAAGALADASGGAAPTEVAAFSAASLGAEPENGGAPPMGGVATAHETE
jgi:hypothetical protein